MQAGKTWRGASQQSACNCLRMFSFQAASLVPKASFHCDAATCLANPVGGAGAVVSLQGSKRPVGIGHHVDAALGADQDGDICRIRCRFGSRFGSLQNCFGIIQKGAHNELIGMGGPLFRNITGVPGPEPLTARYASGRLVGLLFGSPTPWRYRYRRTFGGCGRRAGTNCFAPEP